MDGQPLGERNPKWLQDDYVKFLRFGQWRIERTGAGILAFITNHGYLDNPTFRGMRQQLMNAFTDIYVLDLHGNAKKKEKCPDGSKDENVFDIQQGVAIGIFVKEAGKAGPAKVRHADLWGLRESKYKGLFDRDVATSKWKALKPKAPFYLFVPQDTGLWGEYEQGWKVTEIMPVNSVGIVTARDRLTIRWSKQEVQETIRDFVGLPEEEARTKYSLGNDVRDWKVSLAQQDLRNNGIAAAKVKSILYRPFDRRFTYYTGQTRGFICMPRPEVMRHMLARANLALITSRLTKGETFRHAQVTRDITEVIVMSPKTSNNGFVFPIYLYPATEGATLSHWPAGPGERRPNLNPAFVADMGKRLGLNFVPDGRGDRKKTFGPEDVFHYIYAVFHSPTYRKRYAEFLKIDFPRVPLTSDVKLFRSLCRLGAELVTLHLLESPKLAEPIARFPVKGANLVEKGYPKYVAPGEPEPGTGKKVSAGRVYISKDVPRSGKKGQYFEGVPPEIWEFHIGGYQVCEKWLKDRRGRTLAYDDLEHYSKVVTAIRETIRLMGEIDNLIPGWPLS